MTKLRRIAFLHICTATIVVALAIVVTPVALMGLIPLVAFWVLLQY